MELWEVFDKNIKEIGYPNLATQDIESRIPCLYDSPKKSLSKLESLHIGWKTMLEENISK